MSSIEQRVRKGEQPGQKPWWNRPLIGNQSVTERIRSLFNRFQRAEIPERALKSHSQALQAIHKLVKRAQPIDNEKYGNPEFLSFVRLKRAFAEGHEGYENLDRYLQLLHAGISAKNTFVALERMEFKFYGSKQAMLYDYVETLFQSNVQQAEFLENLHAKFTEVQPQLRTEDGKAALEKYYQHLEKITKHRFGFRLLRSFKRHKMTNYSMLNTVANIIDGLNRLDLHDLGILNTEVIAHYETFQRLGEVLGMPDSLSNPKTFGRMLQYIALEEKYKNAYPKFQELVVLLEQWYKQFTVAQNLRNEYNPKQYKQVKEFAAKIPGVGLYNKYKVYFSDGTP
ncbi:hypothetical protein [Acaryochloris sp. IP29b_bin.137]|uniref:hypothetical protein n=1 Tax=Acaryochloris sp. IP29b_bin.137 TaxID=2969217 RepID=UPI0026393225|nr:hypothetical protein [Acaryochloris sp. IP29b_bin.137]